MPQPAIYRYAVTLHSAKRIAHAVKSPRHPCKEEFRCAIRPFTDSQNELEAVAQALHEVGNAVFVVLPSASRVITYSHPAAAAHSNPLLRASS